MPSNEKDAKRPIIIIKKKRKGHASHHGGSWKVAYADFVTAMMAFFMVLWLIGLNEDTKKAIAGYFQNPVGFKDMASAGSSPLAANPGKMPVNPAQQMALRKLEEMKMKEIQSKIQQELLKNRAIDKSGAQVDVAITDQGMRIELIDAGDGKTFFPLGSPTMTPVAKHVVDAIGEQIRSLQNSMVLEGHTDAAPMGATNSRTGYSNWELSTERANSARKELEAVGVDGGRVREVRGYADRNLRYPDDPLKPGNRRISILMPYTTQISAAALDSTLKQLSRSGEPRQQR